MEIINTSRAPKAIGTYSQAVKANGFMFVSGQIALIPDTMEMVPEIFSKQVRQVFANLAAIAAAGNLELKNIVKLTVFLKDLANFKEFNQIMEEYFIEPYPARAVIGVSSLPRDALIEVDAVIATNTI